MTNRHERIDNSILGLVWKREEIDPDAMEAWHNGREVCQNQPR